MSTEEKTDRLSEAMESPEIAREALRIRRAVDPETLDEAVRMFLEAAERFFAPHLEQKGAEGERLRYGSVVAAARFLADHSAGHPSRPSARRSAWSALERALAALSEKETDQPGEES